ncbi:DNA repair protein [Rhizomicrobium sp. SCGC AG-212-E05]|nr:DNA repair protein [Rhizomicrobium sp. SCGC AG-212-E05]
MFGLIDGNSFYCSCERAFYPRLRGRPVVVLSNNDGCIIARTTEAKALGLKMGEPWHLVQNRPGIKTVEWRSSNYELYGDMSRRMYQVLEELFPIVEPYSIDEMFLDLRGLSDAYALSHTARDKVRSISKIPTCVGIGATKTIAKLANGIAKDQPNWHGVCDMSDPEVRDAIYTTTPLSEVWGMGPASVERAAKHGAFSVADFVALPTDEVRKLLTVTGLRTHAELKGQSCLSLSLVPPQKKMLACTRSFSRVVTTWEEIRQAIATYAEIAAKRLRQAGLYAAGMQVFLETNPFSPKDPQYSPKRTFGIEGASDTRTLIGAAVRAAERMWRPDFRYHKVGVVLLDLYRPQTVPPSLFPSRDPARSAALMRAMDAMTDRYGRGAVRIAATAPEGSWNMKRGRLSPRYTTAADEMLNVGA